MVNNDPLAVKKINIMNMLGVAKKNTMLKVIKYYVYIEKIAKLFTKWNFVILIKKCKKNILIK